MANDLVRFPRMEAMLQEYGEAVLERYKTNMVQSDALASEKLLNTAQFILQINGSQYEVQLSLQDYWKFVEYDTKPHFPPLNAIKQWIRIKPVIPRPNALGRTPSEDQLAYLIGRKIAEEGTEGRHDLTNAVEEMNREYLNKIASAFADDVNDLGSAVIRAWFTQ